MAQPYFRTAKVSSLVGMKSDAQADFTYGSYQSFADIPVTSDGVETASFLKASTDFVNMFGVLQARLAHCAFAPLN